LSVREAAVKGDGVLERDEIAIAGDDERWRVDTGKRIWVDVRLRRKKRTDLLDMTGQCSGPSGLSRA
jgi:hypothetical protein